MPFGYVIERRCAFSLFYTSAANIGVDWLWFKAMMHGSVDGYTVTAFVLSSRNTVLSPHRRLSGYETNETRTQKETDSSSWAGFEQQL